MNRNQELDESKLELPEEVIIFLKAMREEMFTGLVLITPDPSKPESLYKISRLQGGIILLDELLEKHYNAVELNKPEEG